MLKRLPKICLLHKNRGEQIAYFNISPYYYKELKKKIKGDLMYRYLDQRIPIISEGWIKKGDAYIYEMTTTNGTLYTMDLVYAIK